MVMKNPFVTNGLAGPSFCDRVEETQHMAGDSEMRITWL